MREKPKPGLGAVALILFLIYILEARYAYAVASMILAPPVISPAAAVATPTVRVMTSIGFSSNAFLSLFMVSP